MKGWNRRSAFWLAAATLAVACAGAPRLEPARYARQPEPAAAPAAATPKRIVAAIQGDPLTLSDSINWAASGSTVAGVDTIEQLLHAGLLLIEMASYPASSRTSTSGMKS